MSVASGTGPDRIWGEWEGKPLEGILAACRDLLEDPGYPTVRAWRAAGGKVFGHFQVYCPEEIPHAAGMLPVKVMGSRLEARQADARFGSYLCSIVKTSLEPALGGQLPLDMFVTHPICDAARNLAAIWGRNVRYPCEILYLPQNANSRHAAGYLAGEYRRLLARVEEVTSRPVSEAALAASVAVFNENRRLLRDLYAMRRERPWLLSVYENYLLMAVGTLLPRGEHNALLARALAAAGERRVRPRDKIRVVLVGGFCEQPPLDLLRSLTESCDVVDDDLLVGIRWITGDVAAGDAPLHALAEAYLDKSGWSPVQHDLRKPKERMLLSAIRQARATAVVVLAAKMCEPGLEEQVAFTKTLEKEGIPYFVSEFEENMTSFDSLDMQLETFVESVLFE